MDIEKQSKIEFEIKPVGRFSLNLRELWQYKELFYFFTWRDLKVKYKHTFLGFAWAILQPGLMMLVFTYFFGNVLAVPSYEIPYPVFVYSGLMFWNLFSSGVTNSGDSMIQNANIIKKVYFPRLIVPISAIMVSIFDFLMTFILYFILLIYFKCSFNFLILLVCLISAFVITVCTTFGLGIFLSALNVKYRDFRYVMPFLILMLMFLTPVIYPLGALQYSWTKYILALNPLTAAITLARFPLRHELGDTSLEFSLILISIASVMAMIFVGIYIFKKTEAYFADIA